jgi:hypothetical protein
MHGREVIAFFLIVLAVLNVPVFLFGFLAYKALAYALPEHLRSSLLSRWATPFFMGLVFFLVGMVVVALYMVGSITWFTEPYISYWWWLVAVTAVDFGLVVLWPVLKIREMRAKRAARRTNAVGPGTP